MLVSERYGPCSEFALHPVPGEQAEVATMLVQQPRPDCDFCEQGGSDATRMLRETLSYLEPGITIFDAELHL